MPIRSVWRPKRWASLLLTGGLLVGCSTSEKKLSYVGKASLDHYKDVVTSIDYPNVDAETPDEVSYTDEPRRIRNPRKEEVWNLSLEEALHSALANAEIIRDNGQFLSPGNRLLTNPDFVQSVYDPAIQDSSTLFGQSGVEAALSEFDATFSTSMTWGRSENISETAGFNGIEVGNDLAIEAGDFRSSLSKILANGAAISATHNVLYQNFNQGADTFSPNNRLFPSFYSNNPSATQNGGIPGIEFDFRQPLWAGSGTRFTRIAGPVVSGSRRTLQNITAVNQGIVISRIRTDIAIAEFEQAVQGLAKDVEDVYWELYLAYRRYDAELVARNSALITWRNVKVKVDQGLEGGGAADEAQARDSYFEIRARTEQALADLYNSEGRMRRLLGLPVNDGRIIRPSDEPTTAEFLPEWRSSLVEALTRRVELRKQKWNIRSLEFQLEAAKSLTHPRLDFVSRYQINGFGDKLFGKSDSSFAGLAAGATPTAGSFYENLLTGNQTGWGLGFEFNMPIGFRAAHSQVRNIELRLAKARSALGMQEHEISHELAQAFRQVDAAFQTAQTNFNRRRAAERRVQAYEEQYKVGRANVDLLLRSQISLAQAESSYYQSLVGYNRAIVELKYRKGTLLEDDAIFLSESLSHPESYLQALRRAWSRSHAFNAGHLKTEPAEFATDESDPVEMGESTYSGLKSAPESQPTPPEPVPASELPVTEPKPVPQPREATATEPPAPAQQRQKELPVDANSRENSAAVRPASGTIRPSAQPVEPPITPSRLELLAPPPDEESSAEDAPPVAPVKQQPQAVGPKKLALPLDDEDADSDDMNDKDGAAWQLPLRQPTPFSMQR